MSAVLAQHDIGLASPSTMARPSDAPGMPMRILVHDFSGHPFQVQLSRALAERGHRVRHLHCASETTGKGALQTTPSDARTLQIAGIELEGGFRKYGLASRWWQERHYGDLVIDDATQFRPDVVLSSNTPLFAQRRIGRWATSSNVGFVFWVQDVLSIAMRKGANRRVPGLGSVIGRALTAVERDVIASSDRVVLISDDFVPVIEGWRIESGKVDVVENWAPLAELPQLPKENAWARRHGLDSKRVLLYSGTLGMKHNPALLVDVAAAYRQRPDVVLVIVSEGLGADWVAREARRQGLTNILQLPYQPYDDLPEVLATADVLLAILEPDAGAFSVPSKVLSYHCAGRPIVAAVPSDNLAARVVRRERSGIVVDPTQSASFVSAVSRLIDDPEHARHVGQRARAYAERAFDITAIASRFEHVLMGARRNSFSTYRELRNEHA